MSEFNGHRICDTWNRGSDRKIIPAPSHSIEEATMYKNFLAMLFALLAAATLAAPAEAQLFRSRAYSYPTYSYYYTQPAYSYYYAPDSYYAPSTSYYYSPGTSY